MYKLYVAGKQRDAAVGVAPFVAIFEISFYRAPDGGELYTYLVFASCQQIDLDEMIAVARSYMPVMQPSFFGILTGCIMSGRSVGTLYCRDIVGQSVLSLGRTVAAVVSLCDSMNYITDREELLAVFRLVNNYLDPGGVFIFDLNTEYKYRELLGDTTIAENREEVSFIWENLYDAETHLNEYCLTLFAKAEEGEEGEAPLYEKYEEVHLQRAYSLEEIKELLSEAGLKFLAAYDVLTHEAPGAECERMYIVAGEGYQSGKVYL